MRSVNIRSLLLMLLASAALAGGTFALNRYQVYRNAGNLAKQARQRLAEGKPAEAMGLFTRYLGMRPDDAAVLAEYAELLLERTLAGGATQADFTRTYNTLEEAVRRNPDRDALRRKLAEFELQFGRPVDAREHLEVLQARLEAGTIERGAGDDAETPVIGADALRMMIAQSYAAAGDFETAATLASELIGYDLGQRSFDPAKTPADVSDAYVLLASILQQRLSDAAAAEGVLRELVARRGSDAKAWLAMARWHRQAADFAAASQDVEKAAAIAPDDHDVVFSTFELAFARQDLDKAAEVAARARKLFPGDERSYRGLATVAMQRNDLPGAEEILREGAAALPNAAALQLMLADVLLQQNKLEETDRIITRIKELYGSTNPAVGLIESRVLIAKANWPQARQKLEQIRPLAVGVPELTRQIDLCLGQCFEQLQEFDQQLGVHRRILIDDPMSLAARVGAATALASAGQTDDATREFEAVAALIPPDRLPSIPQVWYPLIQMRLARQLKRPQVERDWSGIDALVKTIEESPAISPAQVALLRAEILARRGEPATAIDLLDKAARAGSATPQIWAALATLTLGNRGLEAARDVMQRVPADMADQSGLMLVAAQLAAADSGAEAGAAIAAIADRAEGRGGAEAAGLLTSLASIHLSRGARAEAMDLLRRAASCQPDDLRSRTALLELVMAEGDVERATAAAADIQRAAGPTNARSLVAEAAVKILEARKALLAKEQQAGRLDPSADDVRALDDARNLLIQAENERPGWHLIQRYFAEVEALKGDLGAAIDRLKKAVELDPANPDVVRQLVGLLYATNRIDEARVALESMDEAGFAGFERVSAEIEMRTGSLEKAVTLAERSVKADSKDPGDLIWLGQLLDRSGKPGRAGELLSRAVELAPDRPDTWFALFAHHLGLGKRRAAENTLDRAAAALGEPQRQRLLAQGYELLGRIDDAERAYRAAADAAADDVGSQRAVAEFLVRHGRLAEARKVIEAMVSRPDDKPGMRSAKEWGRRKLAEFLAAGGTYRDLQQALALVGQNARGGDAIANDDAVLEIRLLANRPEPASWTRAIDVLQRLSKQQTLSNEQRLTLAGLLAKTGRWDEARGELLSIASIPNAPPPVIAVLVENLIDHEELSSARSWLKRLADAAPTAPVTLALQARLAMASKDKAAAAEAARQLMPSDNVASDDVGRLAVVARLMEDLGFPKAADQVLAKLVAVSAEGVISRAEFLGRHDRAAEALDLLASRWDDLPLERLLTAAMSVARASDAATTEASRLDEWFTRARRVDPGSVAIPMLLAELRSLQGKPEEVERIYRELLARPAVPPVQKAIVSNNLAFHLATPATAAEARKLIDAAIDTLGPHPDLLDTRALVHLALGQDKEAVADLEQAALQPTDLKLLHLAYAQFRVGENASAARSLAASRKKGLDADRLSSTERSRLLELEAALKPDAGQAVNETGSSPAT